MTPIEIWDKPTIRHLQSIMYDVGGFMTAIGDISPFDVVNDVLQINVVSHNEEFSEELVLTVLFNMLHKKIPAENINLIYFNK